MSTYDSSSDYDSSSNYDSGAFVLTGTASASSAGYATETEAVALAAVAAAASGVFGPLSAGGSVALAGVAAPMSAGYANVAGPVHLTGRSPAASGVSGILSVAGYVPPPPAGGNQAPIQQPAIPVATPHVITYYFTDNFGNKIEELPLTNVTFSLALNDAGQLTGTLPVEDPRVQNLNWVAATAPNLACVWVIIDGATCVWGGMVQQRNYTMSTQTVEIRANEFANYLNQRVQAFDYSTNWATQATQAGAMTMGAQIISDALDLAGTLGVLYPGSTSVVTQGATPAEYFIIASFPISQQQQIGSLIQQLQTMGYLVGFDFATDVGLVQGVPYAQITLSYPRRGRVAGTTGLMVDTAYAGEFTYPEDGTQQADRVWELATASGGVGSVSEWVPAFTVDDYPLLEVVESHMVFSALTYYTNEEVSASQAVLNAFAADDLMLYAYPPTAPTVTVPMFGANLAIGDFIVGDDIRVLIPKLAGGGPGTNPRFPNGMDFYWRVVKNSVQVNPAGLSTMTLTLNMPPTTNPQRPPN